MRLISKLSGIALMTGLTLVATSAKADVLYGTTEAGEIYTIDTTKIVSDPANAFTKILTTGLGGLNGLAFDDTTSTLFFRSGAGNSDLYKWTVGSGFGAGNLFKTDATLFGNGVTAGTNNTFNAAFYNGAYYGIVENTNKLLTVNGGTGAVSVLDFTSPSTYGFGDIAIHSDGTLYGSADRSTGGAGLFTMNTTTLAASNVATSSNLRLQIAFNGLETSLWGQDFRNDLPGGAQWYTVNKTTGVATAVGGLVTPKFTDLAGPKVRIPEPGTLALLGIGMVAGAFARRRRA
jgi:hypothetical protein